MLFRSYAVKTDCSRTTAAATTTTTTTTTTPTTASTTTTNTNTNKAHKMCYLQFTGWLCGHISGEMVGCAEQLIEGRCGAGTTVLFREEEGRCALCLQAAVSIIVSF